MSASKSSWVCLHYMHKVITFYVSGLRKQSDAYLKEETHTILASSNLDSSQINFHIPAVNNMYTDPASLRVYFEIAITDKNGVPVPTGLSEARVKKIIEYRGQLDMWEALPDKDKGESEDESGKMMKPKLPAGITQELVDSCIGKVRLANDLASNFFSEVRVNINDRPMQVTTTAQVFLLSLIFIPGGRVTPPDQVICSNAVWTLF